MAKNTIRMPQSTAGITGFSDSGLSNRKITPAQVIAIIIIMIVLVAALHLFGGRILL